MIRGYIAQSADGFVADKDGGVGFLDAYQGVDYGYEPFMAEIDTVVMGRATYDQIVGFDVGWPYAGKRGVVVTSSPLETVLGDVRAWSRPLSELADDLAQNTGDTWIVGGPKLQAAFIELGALERLDLFVMPVLLGAGVPLFASDKGAVPMELAQSKSFDNGVIQLEYRLAAKSA
ncbi:MULTISPECIES: dihydrofolate reductase family protein [Halocynthiibacter]|uniref:Dihydrofolate reductase family protein n=1 Tax=Halocynthiibacter halioticoli TaxID=2986804 RepID=A0AAE3IXW7_9RHOB|nr:MULTISPECIES: dihydrofolate reductase family protein [Halocynthiibacter]MCV6824034.1 dihydrofolate reductase family protein [Halocynthiibacter halioticoli]MCW4057035.1 dihydrofolate reductase family protein [Halocynthiibacter sp. SDUM655004]